MSPRTLFEEIVGVSPQFGEVMREHLADNDGLLPYLLMSDLLRYIGTRLIAAQGSAPASRDEVNVEIGKVLQLLDTALIDGDPETENTIAVSFIEDIDSEKFFRDLEPMLGPNLRAEHRRQLDWPVKH
jgi:hypothetical protein